ncbi:hypothetical protein C3B59_06705 [Cryobacterium zongtaii]|uniref:Uncharacterized protein n=1 Tax=Cryobacterium zongtaii TaxID=1259217 RepID=A0A2S3ZJJ4_9MICO|nr:hypothetical protein C3B59_06705 [Cryobacterium zongtaii]
MRIRQAIHGLASGSACIEEIYGGRTFVSDLRDLISVKNDQRAYGDELAKFLRLAGSYERDVNLPVAFWRQLPFFHFHIVYRDHDCRDVGELVIQIANNWADLNICNSALDNNLADFGQLISGFHGIVVG